MCQALAVRRLLFFAIAMVSWLAAEKVKAGGLIEFPNLEHESPAQLLGYLARPDQGLPAYLGGRAAAAPYPAWLCCMAVAASPATTPISLTKSPLGDTWFSPLTA